MKHSPDQPKESLQVRSLRMTDSEFNYIKTRHNGLSAAIRLLTKGGKYEQQAEQIELLTKQLKKLKG